MGPDYIPYLQGVLEWPGGANAPMHPLVSAPEQNKIVFNSKVAIPNNLTLSICMSLRYLLSIKIFLYAIYK